MFKKAVGSRLYPVVTYASLDFLLFMSLGNKMI